MALPRAKESAFVYSNKKVKSSCYLLAIKSFKPKTQVFNELKSMVKNCSFCCKNVQIKCCTLGMQHHIFHFGDFLEPNQTWNPKLFFLKNLKTAYGQGERMLLFLKTHAVFFMPEFENDIHKWIMGHRNWNDLFFCQRAACLVEKQWKTHVGKRCNLLGMKCRFTPHRCK